LDNVNWQAGLLQQIPWGVILVYVMERFLKHLDNRDKMLGGVLGEFTVAVREMGKEVHALRDLVSKLDTRFRG